MKKPNIKIYPNSQHATNLSLAGSGIKLLSWLAIVLAVILTVFIFICFTPYIKTVGMSFGIIKFVDEFEDIILVAIILWCTGIIFRFISEALNIKAEFIGSNQHSTTIVNKVVDDETDKNQSSE